jgi:serine/threonine protein kinase
MLKKDNDGHRLRYGCEVDWFSLGCVTYEFIVGVCPFKTEAARKWNADAGEGAAGPGSTMFNVRSSTTKSTKSKTKTDLEIRIDAAVLEMEPDFSDPRFDPLSISFCQALLSKERTARLGYNGAEEVMQHPFFNDINWDDIISDEFPPPTQPRRDLNMATQDEIGMFSDAKLAKKIELKDEDFALFNKWDYVRPDALYDEAVRFMTYEEEHVSIVDIAIFVYLFMYD